MIQLIIIISYVILFIGCPRGGEGASHVQPLRGDLREPLQDGEAQAKGALGRRQGQGRNILANVVYECNSRYFLFNHSLRLKNIFLLLKLPKAL